MKATGKLIAVVCLLFCHSSVLAQIVVVEPGYQIINTFTVPANLSDSLGTMLFSTNGNTVYVMDEVESSDSAVWSASVSRDAAGDVTGFGSFSQVFAHPYMDTGLDFGPGTGTFFFAIENLGSGGGIGQRLADTSVETTAVTPYDDQYGGLAFIPGSYTNGGDIVAVSSSDGTLYRHAVSPDGDGSFTVTGAATLYADFSTSIGTGDLSDIIFITSGPLAGNAMMSLYGASNTLVYFPIDADGLPAGGTTPTPVAFATGNTGAWGVAIDPVTDNIWMIDYDASDDEEDDVALTQIGGPSIEQKSQPIPSLGRYGLVTLILLMLYLGFVSFRRYI